MKGEDFPEDILQTTHIFKYTQRYITFLHGFTYNKNGDILYCSCIYQRTPTYIYMPVYYCVVEKKGEKKSFRENKIFFPFSGFPAVK